MYVEAKNIAMNISDDKIIQSIDSIKTSADRTNKKTMQTKNKKFRGINIIN